MGKKGGFPVFDFLYSIDYGVCHGPVDSFNEVWVKDKRVFCGTVNSRQDVNVNLPDLFGGAQGEGGCVGEIECYVGSDPQTASDELASRMALTPSTAPGYPGIAHLFFRGLDGTGTGFRWTSQNPYLPKPKASVTRLSKTLSDSFKSIFPFKEFDGNGKPVAYANVYNAAPETNLYVPGFDIDGPNVIDLSSYSGVDYSRIDAGLGWVSARLLVEAENSFGEATSMVINVIINQFKDSNGVTLTQDNATYPYSASGTDTALSFEAHAYGPIPPGARSFTLNLEIRPFVPLGTTVTSAILYFDASYYAGEPTPEADLDAHCDVEGAGLARLPNANPAHVIHEIMVNDEWGKGEPVANMDVDSFMAAAETYYTELFGIAFIWVDEDDIDNVIQQVVSHTNSAFFQDPQTGKWKLKPLRDDYDAAAAPLLDPTNCVAKDRKRRAWGEIENQITVEYTDPVTEKVATVTAHNLSSIAIQGGVRAGTREFPMIRDPYLAQVVAEREVRSAGYPLFSCVLETDRSFWTVNPGDVVRFTWPEDGISEMVLRVMQTDRGSRRDGKITLHCVEDVFSHEQTTYALPQKTKWVSDRTLPTPLDAELAMTVPLPVLMRNGIAVDDLDAAYPSVNAMFLGSDASPGVIDIQAHTDVVKPNGSTVTEAVATFPPTRSATTGAILVPEAASTLPKALVASLGIHPTTSQGGEFLLLGDSEGAHEIVMLDSYDGGAEEWTIARGIYDTLPGAWPVGTRVWRFHTSSLRLEAQERAAGENVTYRFLPRTSEGRLPYASAADIAYTATERPHLPFRPADCQLDGAGFGILDYTLTGTPATVTATWANRNRTMEDALALRWDDANATPEAGQTTVLRILDESGTEQNEITGLTGTSHDITSAEFSGVEFGFVEFLSERDGLRSRVGARRAFDFRQGGYGQNYGNYYGP